MGDEEGHGFGTQGETAHDLVVALNAAASAEKRVAALEAIDSFLRQVDGLDEVDIVAASIKSHLKNANQFVWSKALAVSATLAHNLDVAMHANPSDHKTSHDVRISIQALVPSLAERLAEHREKTREAARSSLLGLARAAAAASSTSFSAMSSHAHETVLGLYQRLLIESGLHAKSARIKEQATLLLPAVREVVSRMPLRPFLSTLVDHLGDADPSVREASRSTSIVLFSRASPVAKAELKKELEKKGVRKQTADAILAEVIVGTESNNASIDAGYEGGQVGSSHGSASHRTSDQAPTRSASRTGSSHLPNDVQSDVPPAFIASRGDLERSLAAMETHFVGKETEHNWLAREQAIIKIRGMLKTSVPQSFPDVFVAYMKHMQEPILKAASSLRTTLSTHGLALIEELAEALGDDMDALADAFLGPLLKMSGSTKKLVVVKSQQAVRSMLSNVSYRHKFLDLLWQTLQDKNVSSRIHACQHLSAILAAHGQHRRAAMEHHGGLDLLTNICKKALTDQNKDVRAFAREAFFAVEKIWPASGQKILLTLDTATKRQIEQNRGVAPPKDSLLLALPRQEPRHVPTVARAVQSTAPPRTPGTPGRASDAILAAKRAAAARLAQEKRDKQMLEGGFYGKFSVQQEESAEPVLENAQSALLVDTKRYDVVDTQGGKSSPSPRSKRLADEDHVDQTKSPVTPSRIPIPSSPTFQPTNKPQSSSWVGTKPRGGSVSSVTSAQSVQAARHTERLASDQRDSIVGRLDSPAAHPTSAKAMSSDNPIRKGPDSPRGQQLAPADSHEELVEQSMPPFGDARMMPIESIHGATEALDATSAANDTKSNASVTPLPTTPIKGTHTDLQDIIKVPSDVPSQQNSSTAIKWFLGKASRLDNVKSDIADAEMISHSPAKKRPESQEYIADLEAGSPSLRAFKALVSLSKDFKLPEKPQPSALNGASALGLCTSSHEQDGYERAISMWQQDNLFLRLFDALLGFLQSAAVVSPNSAAPMTSVSSSRDKTREIKTAALVLLHRLVENQYGLISSLDRDRNLIQVLLEVTQRGDGSKSLAASLRSGCQAVIEKWADQSDPIIGVSIIRSSLMSLLRHRRASEQREESSSEVPTGSQTLAVSKWILALHGLGRLFQRLDAEIIEDQLQHCKDAIKFALEDGHIEMRQQAVSVLVAANKTLQDPSSLFSILQPLDRAQQDLVTYYMSKAS